MLMRAAAVVQALKDLFYVLLHVLFYCDCSFTATLYINGQIKTGEPVTIRRGVLTVRAVFVEGGFTGFNPAS